VDAGDSWVARREGGGGEAAFCRLEHVVPWAMRGEGAQWPPAAVELVRHRAKHHIGERFESTAHLRDWAASGGPWRSG
jgi:hypothetical protein